MPGHPAARPGHGHLHRPAPQAAPGLSQSHRPCTAGRIGPAADPDSTSPARPSRERYAARTASWLTPGRRPGPARAATDPGRRRYAPEDGTAVAGWDGSRPPPHITRSTPAHGTSSRRGPPPREADGDRAHLHLRGRSHPRRWRRSPPPASRRTSALRDLTDEELVQLRDHIEANYKVEGDLRREVAADIRRKVEIGCYAGHPAPPGPARARPADPDQRAYPQGPEADRRRQEEARQEVAPDPSRRSRRTTSTRSATDMPPKARAGPPPSRRSGARNARTSPTGRRTSRAPSTTPSCPSRTRPVRSSPGPPPARWASRARASRPRSPRSWPPRPPRVGRWSTACARSTCSSRAPAPAGRPPSVRCRPSGLEVGQISDVTPQPHNGCRPPKRRRV